MLVVVPQLKLRQGDVEYNTEITIDVIKRFRGRREVLIVFPELSLVGYHAGDEIYELAEPLTGRVVERILRVLDSVESIAVGFGLPELDTERRGLIYNSYVVAQRGKVIGIWRKVHLPTFGVFEEQRYFARGEPCGRVISIWGVKVGVAICYDAFFPEIVRLLALRGAEVVAVPAASPLQLRPLWEPILRARAIENGVYVVFSNHVGYKDGLMFFGESRVVSPTGEIITSAPAFEEHILEATIDLRLVELARRVRPTLRDLDPRICEALLSLTS